MVLLVGFSSAVRMDLVAAMETVPTGRRWASEGRRDPEIVFCASLVEVEQTCRSRQVYLCVTTTEIGISNFKRLRGWLRRGVPVLAVGNPRLCLSYARAGADGMLFIFPTADPLPNLLGTPSYRGPGPPLSRLLFRSPVGLEREPMRPLNDHLNALGIPSELRPQRTPSAA